MGCVAADIASQAHELRSAGQRAVLVIASDGAATDGDVAQAMRPLQSLPVWVVVRLCTDDESVVNYWNEIDADLELDMDVLDDLSSEAAEVCAHSPWLNYGPPLHRLREWGCGNKLFDIIDEKRLSPAEMKDLISFVLGGAAAELPHPELDWDAFEAALKRGLSTTPTTYNPLKNREGAWVDLVKLRQMYGKKQSCVVC